ncbi:U2 small nuclear ribonucleo protein A, partial [Jimgerdemannia flammicorona]
KGNKIPAIENLGVTKDQIDVIDLTDNDLRHLTNFPLMPRLKGLLLSNNRITRLDPMLSTYLLNLETLVLTNNSLQEIGDLEPLSSLRKLQYLSLLDNPVTKKQHYRAYVIHKCKSVRVLDFKRVKQQERVDAAKLFVAKDGEETSLAKSITETKSKTFEPGEGIVGSGPAVGASKPNVPALGISPEEQSKIREAIKQATSLDEITRLEKILRSGHLPDNWQSGGVSTGGGGDVEMEEDQ